MNVFTYDNYRLFLNDYYTENKKKRPQTFSYRYFSRLCGFNTSNFIQLVIKEKRNLSLESIEKISNAIKLKPREHRYFKNLVLYNQAITHEEKAIYFQNLVEFREYKEVRLLDDSQQVYFSKWYYPVVREMVNRKDFKPNPRWISQNTSPQISQKSAVEALEVLTELNLIEKDDRGKYRLLDTQLKTRGQKAGSYVLVYHRKMISLGFENLKQPASTRDISGITMSISPAKFEIIREKIEQFREEIQTLIYNPLSSDTINKLKNNPNWKSEDLDTTRVCQLNLQLFHLCPTK